MDERVARSIRLLMGPGQGKAGVRHAHASSHLEQASGGAAEVLTAQPEAIENGSRIMPAG
jgi:hypothetical protein